MQQISDYELELMKIIWANGGTALYAEIVKALEDKGTPWTKNTIITLLSRLANKGFLKTSKTGFRNQYIAIVLETDYQEAQTKTLLDKLNGIVWYWLDYRHYHACNEAESVLCVELQLNIEKRNSGEFCCPFYKKQMLYIVY